MWLKRKTTILDDTELSDDSRAIGRINLMLNCMELRVCVGGILPGVCRRNLRTINRRQRDGLKNHRHGIIRQLGSMGRHRWLLYHNRIHGY